MATEQPAAGAFEALSDNLRCHAERWAVQLLQVPDEQLPRLLERLLRDVLAEVDEDYARENLDEVREWLRLVGHAIVERRHELRLRGCCRGGHA